MDKAHFERMIREEADRTGDKIKSASVFLSLYSDAYKEDAMGCLQLGIAVTLDKPIFLLVPEGSSLPENLRAIAKGIEYFEASDEGSLHAATSRLLDKYERYKIKMTGH